MLQACIHFLTFLHSGDSHGWLTQAGLRLPFALIRVVHLHRGQWGLLLIHAPEHHHLAPQRHSWGPCPCCGQRRQLAPSLALYIQDLDTVQGHASLTTAPQNIELAFMVDRSAVDTALWHGGEILPVQGLNRTHRHLLHRHVSRTERRGRTIIHRTREEEEREQERGTLGWGGMQRWNKTEQEQKKQAEAQACLFEWLPEFLCLQRKRQGKRQEKEKYGQTEDSEWKSGQNRWKERDRGWGECLTHSSARCHNSLSIQMFYSSGCWCFPAAICPSIPCIPFPPALFSPSLHPARRLYWLKFWLECIPGGKKGGVPGLNTYTTKTSQSRVEGLKRSKNSK